MAVTHSGTGTPTLAAGSASSLTPAYPAVVNAGEKAILHVNVKPFSATIATPAGFQLAPGATNPATNGSTASGTNTGSTKEAWFESILPCTGSEGGTTVTVTVTSADSAGAVIHTAASGTGAWATSVFASGNKVGNSANMSAASGTQTNVRAGDLFYVGFAQNASLGTPSADALTQTGVTFGTVTNRSDRAITTGNDTRNRVNSVPVTSVTTPSGGATATYTNASSTSGTVGFLRLREAGVGSAVADLGGTATATGEIVETAVEGSASASLGGTATATGVPRTSGSAAASLGLIAAATGVPRTFGSAVAALGGSAVATGVRRRLGTGAASLGPTATAAGVPRTAGVATATLGGTLTASGLRRVLGAAAAALGFTATAGGATEAPPVTGSGTAALGGTATAAGTPRTSGSATATLGFIAAATGVDRSLGQALAALGFSAIAQGIRRIVGAATAALGGTASASGTTAQPRDVQVLAIVEHSRTVSFISHAHPPVTFESHHVITISSHARTVTIEET